jgi:hypothetical protein
MNKDFVEYEEALELKQLGFDEPCFGYYVDGELRGIDLGMEELGGVKPYYQRFGFHVLNNHDIDNPNKVVVTAPTYSQAFRWFREKYGYHFQPFVDDNQTFGYLITYFTDEGRIDKPIKRGFKTPEEDELVCLRQLIEILKEKKQINYGS